jgi:putative transposase
MAKPLSMDLRERAVGRVEGGHSVRAVAEQFGVSPSSVVKWSQRFRRTGSVAPGKMGGHRRPKIAGLWRDWLVDRIRRAQFTLRELVSELAERGLNVDYHTVWNFVHEQGLSYKKRPSVPPSSKGRTWQGGGRGGRGIKDASTPSGLSSSTRRGRRPTWRQSADGE